MKNVILTIVSVLAVNTINAQMNDLVYVDASHATVTTSKEIRGTAIDLGSNFSYLNKISAIESSKNVRQIEQEIANFNLKSNGIYDDLEKATYEVTFKRKNSRAYVVYNSEGTIIKTNEKYININIPVAIRTKIAKENPGFGIFDNIVSVYYCYSSGVDVIYKIKIRKGKDRRILKFNKNFESI